MRAYEKHEKTSNEEAKEFDVLLQLLEMNGKRFYRINEKELHSALPPPPPPPLLYLAPMRLTRGGICSGIILEIHKSSESVTYVMQRECKLKCVASIALSGTCVAKERFATITLGVSRMNAR